MIGHGHVVISRVDAQKILVTLNEITKSLDDQNKPAVEYIIREAKDILIRSLEK